MEKPRAMKREWKNNTFLVTVFNISQNLGFDAHHIVPHFKAYSSSHFMCGRPSMKKWEKIPAVVYERICQHYSASTQRPYQRQCLPNERVLFKEKSIVFIGAKVTEQLVDSNTILEPFSTAKRLYQYLNWTMRCAFGLVQTPGLS